MKTKKKKILNFKPKALINRFLDRLSKMSGVQLLSGTKKAKRVTKHPGPTHKKKSKNRKLKPVPSVVKKPVDHKLIDTAVAKEA